MKRRYESPGLIPLGNAAAGRPTHVRNQANDAKGESKSWFRIENKKAEEAELYIYDEIGYWGVTAAYFAQAMGEVTAKTINVHLNSPGGEVFDGVAIFNTLVNHPAKIVVIVDGLAASAASFIAQAGDEVIMGRGTTMMIHDASGMAWGNSAQMRETADILDLLSDNIAEMYSSRAGGTAAEWREIMKAEMWYTADEAVEAGLADRVQAKKTDDEDAAENRWDLSVFNYAGREAAPSPRLARQTILNQLKKESTVPPIKNETTATEAEEITPEVEEVVTEAEAEEITPEVEEVTEGTPAVTPTNAAQFGVLINGVMEHDPAKVQLHIASLEGFATEAKAATRKSFVDKLASEGKITGPQVDDMLNLVKTFDDAQYSAYCATMEKAVPLPMFARHGSQNTGVTAQNAARTDRIEVLTAIVARHRAAGTPENQITEKESYIELQTLLAAEAAPAS